MVKTDIAETFAQSEASTHLKSIFKSAEELKKIRGFFLDVEKGSPPEEYLEMSKQYAEVYAEALRCANVERFKAELLKNVTTEMLLECVIEAAFLYEPRVLNTLWTRLFPWG